jgi:hypothetical protein
MKKSTSSLAFSYDVFVAHATEDNDAFVVPLVRKLRASGLGVWYSGINSPHSASSAQAEESLELFLTSAMEECRTGILILSTVFLRKRWPLFELSHWLAASKKNRHVIAVLHGAGIDEVAAAATVKTPKLTGEWIVLPSWDGVDSVVRAAMKYCPPRARLRAMSLEGPGEIVISQESGHFLIGQRGGLFEGGMEDVAFYDFVGNKLHNEYFEATVKFLRSEEIIKGKKRGADIGKPFRSRVQLDSRL